MVLSSLLLKIIKCRQAWHLDANYGIGFEDSARHMD